ncbi:MAG TPA: MFS transporter [Ktedonobacteraceae bacterium]|nr:MFS transporter [Ktedonobacteraceae bacterium]
MLVQKRWFSAYRVYLILSGAYSLFFATITTINLVYQIEIAKLNPLQLVLVGTALETVAFLCQVPTGILADVFSRRLSVIFGLFLLGAAFVIEGSFPNFAVIMAAQALFGIGATFMDGAEQAWISGEVGEERVGHVFMRSTQIGLIGGLLGAALSVALGSIRLNLPVVFGGAMNIVLAGFLLLFMPEDGFQRVPRDEPHSWREMAGTFRNGMRVVRGSTILIIILMISLFYGLSSEGFDRLSSAHFLADFTFPALGQLKPVVWFGILSVGGTLLTLAASEVVRRRVNTSNQRILVRALFVINALWVASLFVFGLSGNFFLAVLAYWAAGVFRRVNQPIFTTWLTLNVDAKVRATVISMWSQMDALGQVVGGPPVGYIGTAVSLRAALTAVGIILSPVLLLFAMAARVGKRKAVVVEEGEVPVS